MHFPNKLVQDSLGFNCKLQAQNKDANSNTNLTTAFLFKEYKK